MNYKLNKIITRFAPSPTGFLHIGVYRTMIFNYLFTKQNNGKLILRIEDTDKERSKTEYEENILESIKWLGLDFDQMHRQSDRGEIYKKHLEKLIADGKAYISKEEKGERGEVIRFKNPNSKISFNDLIRGEIEFDTTELGDFVIAKSLDEPLYHLSVVVDDFEMKISHVIRGDDHISNTPRQILLIKALEAPIPIYAHLPIVLAKDKSKLSKRRGAKAITEYRDEGFLPEALINYMALLGWHPEGDQEIFTVSGLIERFDLGKVQKGGAVFDEVKMRWVNREHLKKLPEETLKKEFLRIISETDRAKERNWEINESLNEKIFPVLFGYIEIYSDLKNKIEEGEFDYLFEAPDYNSEELNWKETAPEKTTEYLYDIIKKLEEIPEEEFSEEKVKETVWDYATKKGRGEVLWPMRYSLTGKKKSPDPFNIAGILGKKETLKRLEFALDKFK